MYFDFDYYRRVLRHVWSLKAWPGRRRMLFRLLVLVPVLTVFHGCFAFLLDYLLFPRLWRQQVIKPVFIVGHARSGSTLLSSAAGGGRGDLQLLPLLGDFFPSLIAKESHSRAGLGGPALAGRPDKKASASLGRKNVRLLPAYSQHEPVGLRRRPVCDARGLCYPAVGIGCTDDGQTGLLSS